MITQILTDPNSALSAPGVTEFGECYKQLNSSVGDFGRDWTEWSGRSRLTSPAGGEVGSGLTAAQGGGSRRGRSRRFRIPTGRIALTGRLERAEPAGRAREGLLSLGH